VPDPAGDSREPKLDPGDEMPERLQLDHDPRRALRGELCPVLVVGWAR
jgi:hypothetical protein